MMIVSVVIMALPISVIGANFTHQWMLFKEEESKSIHAQKVLEVVQSVEDKLSIHSSCFGRRCILHAGGGGSSFPASCLRGAASVEEVEERRWRWRWRWLPASESKKCS